MTFFTEIVEPAGYCGKGLELRHKVQKLRWMGFEREADELAQRIEGLDCALPRAVVPPPSSTD